MDDLPPLSGDLSWMMQSDQISDRALIDRLAAAYFERLCRLEARISGLPRHDREVHRRVVESLARAVTDRHSYWGDSLQRWLSCRLMVQAKKQNRHGRKQEDRVDALAGEPLTHAEVAAAIYDLLNLLKYNRQKKFRFLQMSFGVAVMGFFLLLAASTRWSPISGITPTPPPRRGAPNRLEGLPGFFTYTYSVRAGDTLEKIAMQAGVTMDQIAANNFLDHPYQVREGKVLRIPASDKLRASLMHYEPKPVEPLPPLTIDSSISEIMDRSRHMELNWSTLRANMYWTGYGPAGYAGPVASVSQYMVFMRQPDQWVLVNSEYSYGYSSVQYRFNGILFSKQGSDDTITGDFSNANLLGIYIPFTGILPEDAQVRVLSEGEVAGRKALILEEAQPDYLYHIWYDAQTGFPLRVQSFSPANPDILLYEVVTASIEYNTDIPSSYFDPSRTIPAESNQIADAFGYPGLGSLIPDWIHPRTVPEGSKPPEKAALTDLPVTVAFPGKWDSLLNVQPYLSSPSLPLNSIQIYAGNNLMGTIQTTTGMLDSCLRSPDGQLVMLLGHSLYRGYSGTLTWFWLDHLQDTRSISSVGSIATYAFSPDSSKLAISGCFAATSCGIHLLDLQTGMLTGGGDLQELNTHFQGIAWSPGSSKIAYTFYDVENESLQCGMAVVELSTGQVTVSKDPFSCSQSSKVLRDSGFMIGKDPNVEGCVLP